MGKIFCLMGKSASGKDSIFSQLAQDAALGLKTVVPYTTRPIRSGEVDGETYFFVSMQEADDMEAAGKIIEMRSYSTVHGIWKYFTADDGQIDLNSSDYLLIGTLEAYEKIRDYFGEEQVIPLYIFVENGERLMRALIRERQQKEPKYAEMCRRFLADEQDFAEERLVKDGITDRFENTTKEKVIAELSEYISSYRRENGV